MGAAAAAELGFAVVPVASAAAPASVTLGMGPLASIGSVQHGLATADGQPACQPCAWFYKASGCQSGKACHYCHLCPEGELKMRKKQKVVRLRQEEKRCR